MDGGAYIPAHFTAWLIALRFYQLKVSISHSNHELYTQSQTLRVGGEQQIAISSREII
jgi:hypothetical protein